MKARRAASGDLLTILRNAGTQNSGELKTWLDWPTGARDRHMKHKIDPVADSDGIARIITVRYSKITAPLNTHKRGKKMTALADLTIDSNHELEASDRVIKKQQSGTGSLFGQRDIADAGLPPAAESASHQPNSFIMFLEMALEQSVPSLIHQLSQHRRLLKLGTALRRLNHFLPRCKISHSDQFMSILGALLRPTEV